MNKTELNRVEETLLRFSQGATGPVFSAQAAACAGLAILEAVREFDASSRHYGRILLLLTLVLVVLTGVLVWLTVILVHHP